MKFNLKPKAIKLRQQGFSISDISKKLGISESTASLWCRVIELTPQQLQKMEDRTKKKLHKFFRLVQKQKEKRDRVKENLLKNSSKRTTVLSKRDLFIAGVALYWAEGFKHVAEGRVGFCNSDPAMIKFMIKFLIACFEITPQDISPRLTVNIIFKNRVKEIELFWSKNLRIPLSQFTKPFYQRTKLAKRYPRPENYHGVLRIHVRRSSQLLIEMRGYMEGLRLFAEKD